MLRILQISATKFNNCVRRHNGSNYYLLKAITGGEMQFNDTHFVKCRLMSDSVNKSTLEANSKAKSHKPNSNSFSSPKLMDCPPDHKLSYCKKNQKGFPGKNSQVLEPKECSPVKPHFNSTSSSSTPDSSGSSSKSDSSYKLLVALALAGLGGGLLYYMTRNKNVPTEGVSSTIPAALKIPASSEDIPKYVPYLLIGGGTASFSAFRAIKSHDPKAKVMVISNEFRKPYMRPPLSKELWYNAEKNINPDYDFRFKQWNGASRSLFYEPEEFYVDPTKLMQMPNGGVSVCHGYSVKKILPFEQKVVLLDGTEIKYDKCLIATGCTPKSLDIISSAPQKVKEKVSVFRNPEDFLCLKAIVDNAQSISVIGSGFLGSELSCALSKYGQDRNLKVYQIFHENGCMAKILPEYLSNWTTENVVNQGVNVLPSVQITSVERINDKLKLYLSDGKAIITDHVVLCTGCEVNTDLAKISGLEVDHTFGGFVVNAELEARKNLFVAGDAACFYDPLLGRRRVEHHDHSVVSGRLAGENMTGLKNPYKHQSMFWSDLGPELGYEGIGLIDSSLPTVGVFAKIDADSSDKRGASPVQESLENISAETEKPSKDNQKLSKNIDSTNNLEKNKENSNSHLTSNEDYGRGVIFYLKDNKVVGILLWNIFNRIGLARQIINQNKTYEDLNEVAKLFEIHS